MGSVNRLELRNGAGSGPVHQLIKDGEPVDIWHWNEVPARPVRYVDAREEEGTSVDHVGDPVIEITKREYEAVRQNPNLYYFSTALTLHYRMGLEGRVP